MTAEPTYNKQLVGLTAFFILGDAIISLPVAESGGVRYYGDYRAKGRDGQN